MKQKSKNPIEALEDKDLQGFYTLVEQVNQKLEQI